MQHGATRCTQVETQFGKCVAVGAVSDGIVVDDADGVVDDAEDAAAAASDGVVVDDAKSSDDAGGAPADDGIVVDDAND